MPTIDEELMNLLNSEVPEQISGMEQSSERLSQVATYCEQLYNKEHNKAEAFNTTKKLTLQSLASVAYYVSSLSESLLRTLDFETENLAAKTSEARNIAQIVAIQREKSARREIGKLTVNRNVERLNKVYFPSNEEKTPKYQRTPIDYSLLDGIGHGRQSQKQQQEYGTTTLNRSGSVISNDYSSYGGIYDYNARGTQTLTRNSIRSIIDHQYRTPQLIPSAIAMEQQQQIYQQLQHAQPMISQQPLYVHRSVRENNGGDVMSVNGHNGMGTLENYGHMSHEMSELNFADAVSDDLSLLGAGDATALNMANTRQSAPNYTLNRIRQPPPPQMFMQNSSYAMINYNNGDSLPPPPSTSSLPNSDEPLPPPPQMLGSAPVVNEMVPQNYIEKARVVYAYEAQRPDELTLIEDSVVYVLLKNEDGWYEGVMNGVTGLFPGNYVVPF